MSATEDDGIPVIMSGIAYNQKTGRYRSWYLHGISRGGKFTPTGEQIDDTHQGTQVELWGMAQGLGMNTPYPREDNQ